MFRSITEEEKNALESKVSRGWANFEHEAQASQGFYLQPDQIQGTLPLDLRGTFIRNGPGVNTVYGTPLVHPIDGDGLICKLVFDHGKVFFQARFVDTKHRAEEKAAQRMLYHGSMGTRAPNPNKNTKFRDPAHTNVFYAGNKLFAAYEYASPHTMKPSTLETDESLEIGRELELNAMSAHFRLDVENQVLVTVGFKASTPVAPQSRVSFYEWSTPGMQLKRAARLKLEGVNYVHDFMLTPNWYICHVTPFVDTRPETFKKILRGEVFPGETMRYVPDFPSEFVLVERFPKQGTNAKVVRMPTEPCHIFHFANCRETNGTIEFEACCMPVGMTMEWQHRLFLSNTLDAPGVMHAYTMANGKVTRRLLPGLENTSCEFPTTNPYRNCLSLTSTQSTRYFYLMSSTPGQALPFTEVTKYDTQTQTQKRWMANQGVVGEPCFVPRLGKASAVIGEEDDGWVVCQVYLFQEHRVQFVVLDARTMDLCCSLNLPFHVPFGFHGTFAEEVLMGEGSKL